MANYVATETISLVPGEDLTNALGLAVELDTNGNVVLATSATTAIVGTVAMNADRATDTAAIPVTLLKGKITLVAGGNVAPGNLLVAETGGKVTAVDGVANTTADQFIIGTCLSTGVEDDVIEAIAMGSYTSTDA